MRRIFSKDLLALCAVAAFGALLYVNTLGYPLVWDDHSFVENQPFVQDCSSLLRLADPRNHLGRVLPVNNAARPVWLGSVAADACLHGGRPAGYRITSVLWHLLAAALLMVLVWELGRDPWAALAAGLLFVSHPVHTENVNIVTFRSDILALVFMLLSLLFFLYRRGRTGWRRTACLAAAAGAFGLALLSKEMAATLPFLVLLCDRLFPEPRARPAAGRRRWILYAVLGTLLLSYLWFRMPRSGYTVLGHQDLFSSLRDRAGLPPGGDARSAFFKPVAVPWQAVYESPKVRLLSMAAVSGDYLRLLLWPHPLQGDYSPRPVRDWLSAKPALSVLAWLALLVLAWVLRRRSPLAAFGLFWAPVALLPVSGLWLLLNPQAERYLYVPSAGICIAAAAGLAALARARRAWARPAAAGLTAAVLAAFSLGTVVRNRDYRDDAALFAATVRVDPEVARARFNLARALQGQGRLAEAESEYREALRLWPDFAGWRTAFGSFLLARGRLKEAQEQLQDSLRRQPDQPAAHYFLGAAHWRAGRIAAARKSFAEALRLDPKDKAAAEALRRVRQARGYLDSPAACSAAAYEESRLLLSMPCSPASGK